MTAGRANREREIPPKASVLAESSRDIGYSLHTAVADVIDNSLTAGARTIQLHAETHAEDPAIGILDDGVGMTETELLEAMRLGSRSPLEGRTATDLGRFGLGLKTASFSQCRRLTVVTRKAGATSCAVWDLDTVAARDKWIVELPESIETIPWSDRLAVDGTLVVWQKLDRLVGPDGRGGRQDLVRQLDETARHVEFVFHRFLSGREGSAGRVEVSLNGAELKPFDPFHSHHPATQHHQEEPFVLAGKEIRIQPVTLPHHDKVSKADWTRYGGPEGYVKNQGFYLYRNRRLIVHGTWFGLARQLELTKLCRVRIDMPSSLDAEWKIDVKKAWAQPPPPVRERLRRIIEQVGVPSKRTYTVRGSRLAEDSRLPVWTRSQDKNEISYGIDTKHPLFLAFESRLDPETAGEFRRLVGLIISTLPVDALYADVSASAESVVPTTLAPDDFRQIVEATWRALRECGFSEAEAETRMCSADPFRSRWQEAGSVIDALTAEGQGDS
ncbi:MAG: ATP-binding protein [Acidobacteria bacterium]|nr:ATP-binding protein [Acidobacteriota bacterium]